MKRHILWILVGLLSVGFWNQAQAQQTVNLAASSTAVCPGDMVTLTATASGTPISYQWSLNGTNLATPPTPNVLDYTFTPNASGQQWFSLVVNYGGGVTVTQNIWIFVGAPQIFFVQSNNQQACGPGNYDFFVFLDSLPNGVTPTINWNIVGPAGTTTATGQNPTINLSAVGSYVMTLTAFADPNCSSTFTYNYTVSPPITLNEVITNPSCGLNDGSIDLNPTGGLSGFYVYQWSNGFFSPSITGLSPGTYSVTVSDSLQCEVIDTFTLVPIGSLDYSISSTDVSCLADSTGSIDITPIDSAGNITYLWSTGATTQDLTNVPGGIYVVIINDGVCSYTETIVINSSVLDLTFSTTDAACDGTGGSASVSVTGGTGPYTYAWSNGGTTQTISNVDEGGYSVIVTDSTGCGDIAVGLVEVEDSCTYTISGQVYYDDNQNCQFDGQDFPLQGWVFVDGQFAVYTDPNGVYQSEVAAGQHVVSFVQPFSNWYSILCPTAQSHVINVGTQDIPGLDFSVIPDTIIRDLEIVVFSSVIRPGFPHYYYIYAYNSGTVPMNAVVTFTHDALVNYVGSTPTAVNYDATTRTAVWNISNLLPNSSEGFVVDAFLPASVPIGTPISYGGEVAPITNDATPSNNVFSGVKGVVGSYDPNDKQVAPTGEGTDGLIRESETKLTYTVRFQNTGNYPATFVIIRDTIDENILLRSIKPVGASHDYTMTMDEANRSVEITFANIQLPDSASDPEGSQGYIIFNAQLEPGLAVGTEIENTAFIYFDFNAPIVTNTVKNTIFRPVSVDFELDTEIQLYPNPNTGFFTLKSKTDLMERVVVYDVMGKEVQRLQTNAKEAMVDLTQVAGGMYWVEIQTANNRFLHKVMIEK